MASAAVEGWILVAGKVGSAAAAPVWGAARGSVSGNGPMDGISNMEERGMRRERRSTASQTCCTTCSMTSASARRLCAAARLSDCAYASLTASRAWGRLRRRVTSHCKIMALYLLILSF